MIPGAPHRDSLARHFRSLPARLCFLLAAACACSSAQVDVLTQHNDAARTGANLHVAALTPRSVNQASFGMLFKRALNE